MTKTKGRGRLDGDVLITLYLHVNSNMLIYWSFHCIMAAVKIVWATAFRLSIRIEHFARANSKTDVLSGIGDTMPIGQDNELAVFLIALAVIFVVVIALAAVAIMRRNKRGRTLQNSTYGNNIDSGKEVPTDRSNEKYSYNAGDY